MNHIRLESMFHKKHAPHIHAHKSPHTHVHHAYTYDSLYVNVYICTHCGRTGHFVKFCNNRIHVLNFATKNVWVGKGANPHGPKKVWVQNSFIFF